MNKENNKRDRQPKNTNKVPTTRSYRTSKYLVPSKTFASNSAPSTPSSLGSSRRLQPSNLVTSTPKNSVVLSSNVRSIVGNSVFKEQTRVGKNVRPKSATGLSDFEYISDIEPNEVGIKPLENRENRAEANNNISEENSVEKPIGKAVSKSHEKNTLSKEQKINKRPISKPVKNDVLETNKKGGGPLHQKTKGLGGLFDVKKKEIRVESVANRRIERDKPKPPSALSLTSLRTRPKPTSQITEKKVRPLTIPNTKNINSTKRGHAKDSPGRDIDNISRTSSVTNLESLESQGRSKPPKKSGSKERVDKDGKKSVPKTNNNQSGLGVPVALPQPAKVEPGFHSHSSDSLQDAEIYQLKRQLKEMADEKSSLALQLGEQRGQLHSLHKEIQKLKCFQEESTQEIEKLSEENTTLRNRLRDVAHSPLSDNEKQQLLFENAHMMQSNSAPASIATNVMDDTGGDVTACTTPDWDKHSSSNVSEVSVACLQDRINQMQETHYSTNEELQATLQELTDLQRQLTDLQQENERLNEEKTLMFDSLCRQTERLNDSRQEVESLKQLLYRDRLDENGTNQLENAVEREQNLMELLRRAQEEREALLLKLEQVQSELHESRTDLADKISLISQLSERVKTLECSMDAKHAEHKQMDQELAQARDQCSSKQIEINRLTDLLENARTKINELEQDRTLSDKSELDEMLDNTRKEKDQLESEVAYLKEQLARSKNETEKLKEQFSMLQEECKVTRNNAKTTQSDLEYKCEKLVLEKNSLTEQLQQFQEAVNELQVQTQCHLEDKRQLSAVLSETQRNLSESERKSLDLETEMQELKKLRSEENDEWEKFQNDLLTSVRVANDFKTEAQQELQKIILENKTYREKVRLLEGQLEKLKGEKTAVETQTEVVLTPQLINLAKNFEFPPIFRQESKRRQKKVVSLDSANMDKLFPVLSKERRSRSKENVFSSKEDLTKSPKTSAGTSKENDSSTSHENFENKHKFKLFGKSTENLDNEMDTDLEHKEKLKRNKFWFGKSNENLANFEKEFHKDLQKDNNKKPRKKSKDSVDSLSSGEKEKKSSDFFSRFVKKREKKPQNRISSHPKFMSVEEELLMQSLNNWYNNIDKTVPEDLLSKEDKAIKRLKVLYENDQLKERPIAKKPKEQLAISKPLLTSVVQNPKLDEIVKNINLPNVEEPLRDSALEESIHITPITPMDFSPRRSRVKSDNVDRSHDKKWFNFNKSKSLDNLKYFDVEDVTDPYNLKLYRATETENLTTSDDLILKSPKREFSRYSSEIQPYDSVSNLRDSTRVPDDLFSEEPNVKNESDGVSTQVSPRHPDSVFLETVPHQYEPKIGNDLPKPNIYINYENLDQIVAEIPKSVPESELNEEQKFALKLKSALDDAEKKTVVKKRKRKFFKNLEISPPTKDSVEKNWKLKEIILNPRIKSVQVANKRFSDFYVDQLNRPHSANIEDSFEVVEEFSTRKGVRRNSSSYQNITFSFAPEEHIANMLHTKEQTVHQHTDESVSSTSSRSFTSGEFNLDTGIVMKTLEENIKTSEKPIFEDQNQNLTTEKVDPNLLLTNSENQPTQPEDLLYNETLSKKEKRRSLEPNIDDLGYNETLLKKLRPKAIKIEDIKPEPRIEDAQKQYKKDLQEIINIINVEEKVKPFLHPRLPKHRAHDLHVHYQEPESIVTMFNKEEAVINRIEDKNIPVNNGNSEVLPENVSGQEEKDDSFISYRSSNVSTFLDNSTDSFVVPDSSHDFVHSSGFADQEPRNNFVGLSNDNIESFLEEERKFSHSDFPLDTKNTAVVERVQQENLDADQDEQPIDTNQQSDGYSYQEMVKENKYGVVSPYEVRYSYKNVVSEIKRKFSKEDIVVPDYLKEGKTFNTEESKKCSLLDKLNELQEISSKIDDQGIHDEESVDLRSGGVSQIDKEMQEIIEKYLHTRASLIVQKTCNKNPDTDHHSPALNSSDSTTNLKKYENVENLHELKMTGSEAPGDSNANISSQINEGFLIAETGISENNDANLSRQDSGESLNDEDLQFIKEMKEKYESEEDNEVKPMTDRTTKKIPVTVLQPRVFEAQKSKLPEKESLNLSINMSGIKPMTDEQLGDRTKPSIDNDIPIEEVDIPTSTSSFDVTTSPLPVLSPLSDQEINFTRNKSNQEFRTSSMKRSMIPLRNNSTIYGSLPPDVRKNRINKSLGSHFQRRSLEAGLTYQPVYSPRTRSSEGNSVKIEAICHENEGETPEAKPTEISDTTKTNKHEPFYENIGKPEFLYSNSKVGSSTHTKSVKPARQESNKTEKKPIPRPRIKSQGSFSELDSILLGTKHTSISSGEQSNNPTESDINIDKNENVINMTDNNNKNSSAEVNSHSEVKLEENAQKNLIEAHSANVVGELKFTPRKFDNSELVQAKVVYLDNTESIIDLVPEEVIQSVKPGRKTQEVVFRRHKHEPSLKMKEEHEAGSSKGTLPSKSSIKILGKREELDITKNISNANLEEVPRSNSSIEPSDVNLFKPGSEQSYDSYLELFKSEADKDYDTITGKQKPLKGFIEYAAIGTVSDESNSESKSSTTENAPKIIDFVPLDDKTKPYFTKNGAASVNSTLEREKTFQVLNQAEKIADSAKKEAEDVEQVEEKVRQLENVDKKPSGNDKNDLNCSVEFLARTPSNFSKGSSKSQTAASRTSFSQAKKLFEALAEANKVEEKSKPKTPPKYQVRDSRGSELNIPVNKELMSGSKNIVRETVLLIKDGKNVPVEKRNSQNIVRETVLLVQDGKHSSPDSKNLE